MIFFDRKKIVFAILLLYLQELAAGSGGTENIFPLFPSLFPPEQHPLNMG